MEAIGFIGLGNMGHPMCLNLLKSGYKLIVFDIDKKAVSRICDAGASEAESVSSLSKAADIIITMLPGPLEVKEVYLSETGILSATKKNAILIDSSTIDSITSREVAEAAAKVSNHMLDAPVSGGTVGAVAGTLTFMVGGDFETFNNVKDVFASMGKNIIHCGRAGNGQATKLCNNMLTAISMTGVSEAISLGRALGLDPNKLIEVINTSSGRCWSSDTYNPYPGVFENIPSSKDYEGGFSVNLMLKDVGLAVQSAKQVNQPVLLGALAQQIYQLMNFRGEGKKDFSSVIKMYLKD